MSGDGETLGFRGDDFDTALLAYHWPTASVERIDVAPDRTPANRSGSLLSSLSFDGRFIGFESPASNLVDDDANGFIQDVFVRDTEAGVTEPVSVGTAGATADGPSEDPSISLFGRYVAFTSRATNLVHGDDNGVADVFVHDRLRRTTTRVTAPLP